MEELHSRVGELTITADGGRKHVATRSKGSTRPRGIVIIALLMIPFGLAEVVTGFTHTFAGITTSHGSAFSYAAATIGACYVAAGVLILTLKKWAAALAIVLLVADIAGRIALVAAGLYPLNSLEQVIAIVFGTAIAAFFAVYVGSRWRFFRT
jgi:hypothetical protein